MIYHIDAVYAENETGCPGRLDEVQSVMKIRHDNNMTDCIGRVYAEIETKLSRPN